MNSIGNLISTSRKNKNLTQEDLADLAKVNLRTIQRVENNKNLPRGNTLKLICSALEIDIPENGLQTSQSSKYFEIVINYFFLIVINMTLMGIIGFMTLDSWANINTRFAGLLLSFFIPIFIVLKTKNMTRTERILKFGSGFLIYIISSIIIVGFPKAFVTGLLVCLSICLLTLYYGDLLVKENNEKI